MRNNRKPAISSLAACILALATEQPDGFQTADELGIDAKMEDVFKSVQRLVRVHLLFSVRPDSKGAHYFSDIQKADAFRARVQPTAAVNVTVKANGRRLWAADAPAIITANTKFTTCPSPGQSLRTNTHSVY
jgi:hypothetical protein